MAIESSPSREWIRFYWFALLLVWTLYGFETFLCYLAGQRDPYPATSFMVSLILSGVIVGYKWAFRKMAEFESDIQHLILAPSTGSDKKVETTPDTWYEDEFEDIFDWKKSVTSSALFTVLAFIIAFKIEVAAWFPTKLTQIVGFIPYMFVGAAFGACVWPGYRMSRFVYTLAKRTRQINPFVPWSVGIFIIARTFIKFEAVGILLIVLFGAAFEVSPYRMSNRFILTAATVVSLVWAFWFYFTQSQIHTAMVRYKHEMQLRFAEHYEKQLSLLLGHPEPKAFEELERLIVLKREIESIPVWPFNIRSLIASLGLVVTPLLAALAQRLLGK